MKENLRNSGIDIVGDVPWGTHFCQLYQIKEDLTPIFVSRLCSTKKSTIFYQNLMTNTVF